MHTLFDFITHVKVVEYLISVTFIAGYMLFWEGLKPKPFSTPIEAGKEDLEHVRKNVNVLSNIGKICTAPFIGLAYIVAIPFGFMFVLASSAINGILGMAGKEASFGWRPMEAYLTGKKKEESGEKKDEKK